MQLTQGGEHGPNTVVGSPESSGTVWLHSPCAGQVTIQSLPLSFQQVSWLDSTRPTSGIKWPQRQVEPAFAS